MNSSKIAKRVMDIMRPSVFEEFNMVCTKSKALNMAQGFPDWSPPQFLKDSLVEVMGMHEDQYARAYGHLPLIKAIANEYSQKFGREINGMTEVSVSNGATGVLSNIMCSFLEEGQEVIMFEPAFEFYFRQAEIFEGKVKFLSLVPPGPKSDEWSYDFEAIEKAITDKTKILMLNTPHNPTGKVLTPEEAERFVAITKKWPNLIIVYENMTFDGRKHVRIGSLPDMWDRTISVYSLGKTFSCTGWRAGFAVGHENLIKPLNTAQNWLSFSISRPIQVAFSKAMEISAKPYERSNSYYEHLNKYFMERREKVVKILKSAPINYRVLNPDGGYFVIADITDAIPNIPVKYFYKEETNSDNTPVGDWTKLKNPDFPADNAFCRYMSYEWGVTPLPLSPLFENDRSAPANTWKNTNFIRFALCKTDQTLEKLEGLLNKSK